MTEKEKQSFLIGAITTIAFEKYNAEKPIKYDTWEAIAKTVAIGLLGGISAINMNKMVGLIRNN